MTPPKLHHELHLELLIGKCVLDSTGQPVGRIEEIRAAQQGDDWVIQEYLIGTAAVLERLSAWTLGIRILHLLGAHKIYEGYRVPWDKLELSDPQHPRLRCSIDAIKALSKQVEN